MFQPDPSKLPDYPVLSRVLNNLAEDEIEENKSERTDSTSKPKDSRMNSYPVAEKSTITHEENLLNQVAKLETHGLNPGGKSVPKVQPSEFVFFRPNLVLKFEEIVDELYQNPNRGKAQSIKIGGTWQVVHFDNISKKNLLKLTSENAKRAFNKQKYKMGDFGNMNDNFKVKIRESLQDPTTQWIGPYKFDNKFHYIFSANSRCELEFYGIIFSIYSSYIQYFHECKNITFNSRTFT